MSLGKPPRLERIFQKYDPPLYFVTFCTARRKNILANETVQRAVIEYGRRGEEKGVALGRYVIMPDHMHLFVRGGHEFDLGIWVRGLKRVVSAAVVAAAVAGGRRATSERPHSAVTAAAATTAMPPIWQRGFFDHMVRNSDSYAQK